MLEIRQEQLDGLSKITRQEFCRRLIERLMASNPECFVNASAEDLERLISTQIDKAIGYGIHLETNVCQFVRIQLEEGGDFQENEDCSRIKTHLADPSIEETTKIQQLWGMVNQLAPSISPLDEDQEWSAPELDTEDEDIGMICARSANEDEDDHQFDVEDRFDFEDPPDEWDA